jgi:protein SCO1
MITLTPRPRLTRAAIAALLTVALASSALAQHDHHAAERATPPLSGHSLYHLDDVWTDHHGEESTMERFRGHDVVVVLFYGNCMTACPILLRDAEMLERDLSEQARSRTRFVMVTIDPEHDTPEALAAYADAKGLDRDRWSFLRGDDRAVRRLAAALGVQYRSTNDGHFSHSNLITVLDPEGVVSVQIEGLGRPTDAATAAIEGRAR